jgi:DNA-binding PadR family transcriptional regulator
MVQRFHLTYSSVAVLHAVSRGYRYGFDIMDATGLPSGTVYPALRRLRQLGYVESSWEAQEVADEAKRPRRRYYEIGERGRVALADALQRFRVLNEPLAEAHGNEAVEPS